ncbi:MAG: AraC family transcriptional regulator [Chitinophagaceae bacterium]|nr:AraC family transcriptional regulator [Chitinophagaceae bacterium]
MPDLLKIKPSPFLAPFIKEYWYVYWEKASPVSLSNTPTPEEAICFFPRNAPYSRIEGAFYKTADTFIIRQSSVRIDMLTPNDYSMFKVIFQTGGFYRLFGVPMSLFENVHTETISVLGNSIKTLKEQITNALSFEEMTGFANKYFIDTAKKSKTYFHPVDQVINQKGLHEYSLNTLASDACLSKRQFERKFLTRTGETLKLYQRVIKFNEALKAKKSMPNLTWTNITHMVCYYDQMHLLRDFKQFTNEVPSDFDFENAIIY